MTSRIAVLGLMLESNSFAPVTLRDDFLQRVYLAGDEITEELGRTECRLPAELRAFCATLDRAIDWSPVPILFGLVEAAGPMDHAFFAATLADMRARLEAAMPLDAVYICNHGAMITTEDRDPDGTIFEMVREIVGEVPIVATLDLHGNVSQRMVDAVDVIVAYRTNPHVDMVDRGTEAARAMIDLFGGMRPAKAFIRLPITPPTVTLLTATGPYADLIDYGQSLLSPEILNVSILGGFAYADTPKNGLAILVTARGKAEAARGVARAIAIRAWADHQRYRPRLTPLADAVARAARVAADSTLPAVALADVADNPGGGGGGNTHWIMAALLEARVAGVIIGTVNDAALASEAHERGVGVRFRAVFNRHAEEDGFTRRFEADATVLALKDGDCVGRRGFYANRRMNLGPTALLDLGGIKVVVISIRTQCADPVFLEMMGLDIGAARVVVVKSRGHFRAGFDEFFGPDQVIEADAPGLTSPVLSRFTFRNIPRPAFPIDEDVRWSPELLPD
jgi:microcystin degradation protein MlrC